MESFLKDLETELRPKIQEILAHPFLRRLEERTLNLLQLREFALQYNIYTSYFPRFLAAVAANIPDDNTRASLIENLWEEHGEGNMQYSHRSLFHRFLTALDITEIEWQFAKPLTSTSQYVNALFDLCHNSHFLKGLGAMGPGTEFFTSDEYALIASGLKKYSFLSSYDIEFFSLHIDMDEGHYSSIVSAVFPWIDSEDNMKMVREGAKEAINLEISFWHGLYESILGEKPNLISSTT